VVKCPLCDFDVEDLERHESEGRIWFTDGEHRIRHSHLSTQTAADMSAKASRPDSGAALADVVLAAINSPGDEGARNLARDELVRAAAKQATRGNATVTMTAINTLSTLVGESFAVAKPTMRKPEPGQRCELCGRPYKLKIPLTAEAYLAVMRLDVEHIQEKIAVLEKEIADGVATAVELETD